MNLDVRPSGFTTALRGQPLAMALGNHCPAPRYAIYYAPAPSAPITRLAAAWFGRDLYTQTPCARIARPGLAGIHLDRLTMASAGTAFRCCLTEPFALAGHATEASLLDVARRFAAARSAFSVALRLGDFDRMLALGLRMPSDSMITLQEACEKTFVRLAAPPQGFVARNQRLRGGASRRAAEFHFQMRLTARIPSNPLRLKVRSELEALFAEHLLPSHRVDGIAVSVQPDVGGPSTVLRRFEFGSAS